MGWFFNGSMNAASLLTDVSGSGTLFCQCFNKKGSLPVGLRSILDLFFGVEKTDNKSPKEVALGTGLISSFFIFCLCFDFLELWARAYHPGMLGVTACSIRPYVSLLDFLFSKQLLDFVHTHCEGQWKEPLFSIISMMFKLCFAALFGLLVTSYTTFRNGFQIRSQRLKKFHTDGIIKSLLQTWLVAFSFFLVAVIFLWGVAIGGTPQNFPTGEFLPIHASANIASIFILISSIFFFGSLYEVISFLKNNK
jgi:hypothetical protein